MADKMLQTKKAVSRIIGWREWISLPEWNVDFIKAKVDTGARTSSLHANEIEMYERDGDKWVSFVICPWQRNEKDAVRVDFPVLTVRDIRSSSGIAEQRPVIVAKIGLMGIVFDAELTLTNREQMGFRMLLGREAIRRKFLVNAGRSYLAGRPEKEVRKINRSHSV